MTEYCDVCGDPLSDHPDDFPCAPKPSYPELPKGCRIPHGRRQLAIGEIMVSRTDTRYRWTGGRKRKAPFGWFPLSPFYGGNPVQTEIVSRAKETK